MSPPFPPLLPNEERSMQKIIEGKRYNTETATKVAEHSQASWSDFQYQEEALYITQNGNWFTAGSGGADSTYAVPVGHNNRTGSSAIRLLSPEEAFRWLERYDIVDALEKYFPDRITDA